MSRPRFTYPFRYLPSPAIREAAAALVDRIDATPALKACFAEGKMLGVLLTDRGPIYAFSGLAGGKAQIDGINAGILSPQMVILGDGRDPEEVVEQRAAWARLCAAHGIDATTGAVTTGLANNPAKLGAVESAEK